MSFDINNKPLHEWSVDYGTKDRSVITYFKYVLHSRLEEYEAKGWTFDSDLGPTHGHSSVLMRWAGEGEP